GRRIGENGPRVNYLSELHSTSVLARAWTGNARRVYSCHRRGYVLYGPHGCGKSSIVRQVSEDVVQRDGVVRLCGAPAVLTRGLVVLRRIEPLRPVVCVLEDIDAIVAAHGDEELLSLLDGESQVDHVLNVATTNYPEQLGVVRGDRKSTRLNSSHLGISYAVFCLKKKKQT